MNIKATLVHMPYVHVIYYYYIIMFIFTCRLLITYVKDKDEPVWKGYVYTAVMFTCAVIQSLLLQQYYHYCYVSGMRIRTGIIAAVYKKVVCMSFLTSLHVH